MSVFETSNPSNPTASVHVPILRDPIVDFLINPAELTAFPDPIFVDCTLGGGGHLRALIQKCESLLPNAKFIAFDRDPLAIERAKHEFKTEISTKKLEIHHTAFSNAAPLIGHLPIAGLLADLGISSDQVDLPHRGFSFRFEAPLDMRMNTDQGESAFDFLMHATETEIADTLWNFGEERNSRKIARRICEARSRGELQNSTTFLAELIRHCYPHAHRYKKIHPATQSFQALRITVNEELKEVETLIETTLRKLPVASRIAILTFHSLEDRRIKHEFRNQELYSLPSRKAIMPSDSEIEANSRSRSAKLRLAIRK